MVITMLEFISGKHPLQNPCQIRLVWFGYSSSYKHNSQSRTELNSFYDLGLENQAIIFLSVLSVVSAVVWCSYFSAQCDLSGFVDLVQSLSHV